MSVMKNNIKKIVLGVFVLPLLASCHDFLDKYPTTSLSSGTMFTTSTTAESVLTGAYNSLRYGHTAAWATNLDCFTEIFDPPVDRVGTSYIHLTGAATSRTAMYETFWKNFYEGINRANDVINNFHQVPDMTEEKKAQRIAEAKFLRAWWYYRLNCLWGGVPVFLENYPPEHYFKVSRSSREGVWEVILDDLNDCISCTSLPDKYEQGSADCGRVTKGAAYALRGKVYMWLKDYSKAEKDFLEVGKCGYNLYNGSYADLFTVANEKCNEMIFSVQMAEEKGYGQCYAYNYGNHCTAGTGQNACVLATRFADSFENIDGSSFSWDDVISGYSSIDPLARRAYFLRDGLSSAEQGNQTDLGADMSLYLADGNEARIKAAYENRDPRLAAIAITPYSEYVGGVTGNDVTYTYRYPFVSKNDPSYDLETSMNSNFFYPLRKFVPVGTECSLVENNPLDVPVIRYADVLLTLAEAVNEQGGRENDAIAYINMVRARAGVAEINSAEYKGEAVTTQEQVRERIYKEKKWELAGEQVIYYDELRWGTWKKDKFDNDNGLMHAWGGMILKYNLGGDYYELWPIPGNERDKNNNLVQNIGWIN